MHALLRRGLTAGLVFAVAACQEKGPSESAMKDAWLAWAGRQKVKEFEKVSCDPAGEQRWLCRFRTRHPMRRGMKRAALVANRSGYYRISRGRLTYHGKRSAAE